MLAVAIVGAIVVGQSSEPLVSAQVPAAGDGPISADQLRNGSPASSRLHRVTDSVGKINFEKMTRIGELVYALGWLVANMDHAPARDNRGPRMGKSAQGKLPQ